MSHARILICTLVLLALGCLAKGPWFADYDPVFPGEARLYVYRPSNGGYVSVSLPSGDYQLAAEHQMNMAGLQPVGRSFRVRAGQERYCGYFSSTDVATVQWRMDCSSVGRCKREPLERDTLYRIVGDGSVFHRSGGEGARPPGRPGTGDAGSVENRPVPLQKLLN